MRKRVTLIICSLAAGLGLLCQLIIGWSSHTPHPPPPPEATNVYFFEHNAWQAWDYVYRFDAPPQVCKQFAIALMNHQSIHAPDCTINTSFFTNFPVVWHDFPKWFDVSTVENGLLISGDDWIYAVVDQDRGRLYYYNGH